MTSGAASDAVEAPATSSEGRNTGALQAAALAEAFQTPLSLHGAPQLSAPIGCALRGVRHVELFFDHARIERRLFDGVREPREGRLSPRRDEPGLGFALKRADAEPLRVA